jgi:hypothetical protein
MKINKEWLAAQSRRRKRLLEDAIMFAASAPKEGRGPVGGIDWAPLTTDVLHRLSNAAVDRFNKAAEAIDVHHRRGHFGLRFERGIDHPDSDKRKDAWDSESAPKLAIRLAPCGDAAGMTPHKAIARASNILDLLSASGTVYECADPPPTLTKRKQAELWKEARQEAFDKIARDIGKEWARRLCDLAPWYFDKERLLVLGHLLPKEGTVWQWGPEFWDLMSDLLFVAGNPAGFQHQVTARDGWFNRRGRKTKRAEEFKRAAIAYENKLEADDRRRWRPNPPPSAGGRVPPGWPMKLQNGLLIPVRRASGTRRTPMVKDIQDDAGKIRFKE